jgi:UDP-N-acetylmuramoyl-L-alanyl-D-glutamate--2,6-diaminopimelate ligase
MRMAHPEQQTLPRRLKNLYHWIKAAFWAVRCGFPGRSLQVIAVTGTDGKTSTSHMIFHILREAGTRAALISTIGARVGGSEVSTGLHVTSQDPKELQPLLKKILADGFTTVVLEVTSHALDQHRIWGVDVDIAVLTNIKEDHLDYHGTYENYAQTKGRLFDHLRRQTKPFPPKTAVLNKEDRAYSFLQHKPCTLQITYSAAPISPSGAPTANLQLTRFFSEPDGLRFSIQAEDTQRQLFLPLIGSFNLENALAAIGATRALDISWKTIESAIGSMPQIRGRMQRIDEGQAFSAIVDFAHTPDALERALISLDEIKHGKLIVVFGCAAKRDPGRRRMGEVAARYADVIVITNEDNRDEPIDKIMHEVAQYAEQGGAVKGDPDHPKPDPGRPVYYCIPDRREAIRLALSLAEPGDIVDCTGKGHEQSLNVDGVELPWDEAEVVRSLLRERLG